MPRIYMHSVRPDNVARLSREFLKAANDNPAVEIEVALLVSYFAVAEGCRRFPPESDGARRALLVSKASMALSRLIVEVAGLTDEQATHDAAVARGSMSKGELEGLASKAVQ